MAIDPTLPPTVAEFRAMFPEFSDVPDELIQVYLDISMLWVDAFWDPTDAKVGALYAAAHYVSVHNRASGSSLGSETGLGGGVGQTDPEIGKIWVKSIQFRDRKVSYDRVGTTVADEGGGQETASSDEFWESTPYGQMYLSFRRRNVPHVAVI